MIGSLCIEHAKVVTLTDILPDRTVVVEEGRIRSILPARMAPAAPVGAARIDAGGALLTPGFIDLHTHGLLDYHVLKGPDDLVGMARALPRFGVTGWLPTITPRTSRDQIETMRLLARAAAEESSGPSARVLGFHCEGPYLALAGAIESASLSRAAPGYLSALIEATRPFKAVFSVAPDLPGVLPLIEIMRSHEAIVFMPHTAATPEETETAIAAGASHATHFYDVFPTPPVTEAGVRPCGTVEAIYAHPEVSVDFILDGVHVDPVAVRMALRCKGPDKVCLITDSMVGCGKVGRFRKASGTIVEFSAPGMPARIVGKDGKPGVLDGSGLTMNRAVGNAVRFGVADLPLAVRMATANPARIIGRGDRKGQIKEGYDADLVLLDDAFDPIRTWVGGECVFER